MAYNFRPVNRDQRFLLPVDMMEWLPRDHFVHFLVELVEEMDLSPFLAGYRTDGRGGKAYDPTMMATLLIYAYRDGERSSRQIEERCRTDVAYRFVTGGLVPDHSTIANFRERYEKEIGELFVPVLAVCLRAGLGDVSFAAVDGSKFRCPASTRANRKLASIEKELARVTADIETELARLAADVLAESRRADLADDALPGTPPAPPREPGTLPPVKGLPRKLHGKAARRARLAYAKQALDAAYAADRAAYDTRLAERAAQEAATGKKIPGRKPKPPDSQPDKKINVTDPECRIMKNGHGHYLAGYNAQNTVDREQVSLAADVVDDENDTQQFHPQTEKTNQNLAAAGAAGTVAVFAADSGYRTKETVARLDPDGPVVLLAAGKEQDARRRGAEPPAHEGPPPEHLSPDDRIDWLLATAWGKTEYACRAATVETRFGQLRHNRRFDGFSRVGLPAADSEWKLVNLVENARKLFRKTLAGQAAPEWSALARLVASPG